MAQVPAPASLVNGFVIPEDPHWSPQPVGLPEHFLQPAPPPVDAKDYPDWDETLVLLPEGRRNRVRKCRRTALHIRKHTERGPVESLNPIACGDRVACPYCSVRYNHERAWSGTQKVATVSLTAQNLGLLAAAPVHVIEFKAVIPEWNAAVRVPGCDLAEVRARLCPATSGCIACKAAAQAHAGAAQVEQDLSRWAIDAWMGLRPDTGGTRHVAVHVDNPTGALHLAVTLHIPAVSAKVYPGAKVVAARAERRSFVPLQSGDVDGLRAAWIAFVTANYGAQAASVRHEAPVEWPDVWESFRRAHRPAWMRWTEALARHPEAVVTPDAARTFARAAGIGTIGDSGKMRHVQRTSWFGIFAGKHQLAVMRALDITPETRNPHAQIEVLDAVRLLHKGPTHTKGQSTRTGAYGMYPNEMIRVNDPVDTGGRPSARPDETTWVYASVQRGESLTSLYYQQLNLSRDDAGEVQIPNRAYLESEPPARQTWAQTKRAFGAAILAR